MRGPYLGVTAPLPLNAWTRRAAGTLPYPLDGATRLHARARAGLYQAIRQLGLGKGDVALLPAYHHGSEVEAYVRAGLTPRFYDTGPGILPEPAELTDLLTPDVRVIHMIHYLGLAQPATAWRALADRHGSLLVEDVAQGWLGSDEGRPLGSIGDVALFSVYKSVGVPDGGVAVLHGRVVTPVGRAPIDIGALSRRHVAFLASRSALFGSSPARRRKRAYDSARDFDLGDPDRAAGRATIALIRRLAGPHVAQTRRQHYRRLLAELGPWVPPPYALDPGDSSPFAFPIGSDSKEALVTALREAGIGAVDAWSVPHPALPVDSFPGAGRWRARIALIPVHQELRDADIDRLVRATRSILAAGS